MHEECSRMFQNACKSIDLHAITSAYMQLRKLAWSYMSLHAAVTWACMQLHELACSYMSMHAVPWACMQFPELAGSSLDLHAVPWTLMKFNELTWSSMSLHAVSWDCTLHAVPLFVGAAHKNFVVLVACWTGADTIITLATTTTTTLKTATPFPAMSFLLPMLILASASTKV